MFKELSAAAGKTSAGNLQENVFKPEKSRRQREGYEDGNYTLFKECNAADFVRASDAIAVLGTVNRIVFTTDEEKESV